MLRIEKAGLQTTVQDLGRWGYQKSGVIVSGVMDPYSHRLANVLVGNREEEATIEITLIGPHITFLSDCLFSLTGGDLSPSVNGIPINMWRPVFAGKGSKLSFGKVVSGCRTYLAVAGGIAVPEVMGSRSTYLRAGIGGFMGRTLKKGDFVPIGKVPDSTVNTISRLAKNKAGEPFAQLSWRVMQQVIPIYPSTVTVRVTGGRQENLFKKESLDVFANQAYRISQDSDRMGYRLEGPNLLLNEAKELLSEAVAFGSVQVPPDGQPIILMADRQTTGGYPKIGQVATVDLPKVSQMKPGEAIHFRKISLEEAQRELVKERMRIDGLTRAIALKYKEGK